MLTLPGLFLARSLSATPLHSHCLVPALLGERTAAALLFHLRLRLLVERALVCPLRLLLQLLFALRERRTLAHQLLLAPPSPCPPPPRRYRRRRWRPRPRHCRPRSLPRTTPVARSVSTRYGARRGGPHLFLVALLVRLETCRANQAHPYPTDASRTRHLTPRSPRPRRRSCPGPGSPSRRPPQTCAGHPARHVRQPGVPCGTTAACHLPG